MIKRYLLVISLMLFGMSNIQAQNKECDDSPEKVIIMSESDLINAVTRMVQETRREQSYSSLLKSKMIKEKFDSVVKKDEVVTNEEGEVIAVAPVDDSRIRNLEDQIRQLTATVNALKNPNQPQVVVLDKTKNDSTASMNDEDINALKSKLNKLVSETQTLQNKIHRNQPSTLEKSQYEGMTRSVYFANDKANLSNAALETINNIVSILKADPQLDIMIKGFASQVGNSLYNQNLSLRRADNVKQSFVVKGIAPGRVLTTYHGEDVSERSEAESRRVDLIILDTRK